MLNFCRNPLESSTQSCIPCCLLSWYHKTKALARQLKENFAKVLALVKIWMLSALGLQQLMPSELLPSESCMGLAAKAAKMPQLLLECGSVQGKGAMLEQSCWVWAAHNPC